jgi:dTDP-4-dehydrorhamnose reductase
MRIVVTGASGLLGGRIVEVLRGDSPADRVVAVVRKGPAPAGESIRADLAAPDAPARVAAAGDVVLHCAALADGDACERDPESARIQNLGVTEGLSRACAAAGTRFVFVSTDLVFDGEGRHYRPDQEPQPLMVYGREKRAAERAALAAGGAGTCVVRVALVSGRGFGPRLTVTEGLVQRLDARLPVRLYEDEWRSPVDADSVARALRALATRPDLSGVFHLGGPERLTRHELGLRVARAVGAPAELVTAGRREGHRGAPRPRDVSLDSSRARLELGFEPVSIEAAIDAGRRNGATSTAP